MKKMIVTLGTIVIAIGFSSMLMAGSASDHPDCINSFYSKSLHYTGEGMRHWYEDAGGFKQVTKIPYEQLDCKSCHVKSCDTCHAAQKREKQYFSERRAKEMNTCMPCHGREGLTFKFDGERGQMDVHISAGMVCADCHYRSDVHGDGRFRPSMRHTKGLRASCEECHVKQERESPEFDADTESHSVHGDKLACAACHVRSTVSCYNCHFDTFLDTGKRKGNFIPMKDWLLLINHDDKVTSGNVQTLVYQDKKFIAYAPYFTHSISAEGRPCDDCHQNKAVMRLQDGKKIPVVEFKNGELQTWKGVVPVIQGKLDWVFLNRTKSGWEPVGNSAPPTEQLVAFGTPLTADQLRSLAQEVSP
ncbi:hypothetical protein DSCO28_71540 [Desulfosarcina ovata subsp. sediminis]|uniref:Uncharacterized protein n=1 Tax=Desulfosarcina ovata subsp. sediminis TaxID=885957 RepID=A0A5K8A2G5_9BACT|nr:hypothetical protein [Desulfosarcina ovata]BBO86588.1 hypothetical protein DSCO28_71540 [Desulfosarcina ovata subsp. sediminis]